jgi:predicted membrane protein
VEENTMLYIIVFSISFGMFSVVLAVVAIYRCCAASRLAAIKGQQTSKEDKEEEEEEEERGEMGEREIEEDVALLRQDE